MTIPPLAAHRARELVGRMRGHRVLVVGDIMLDRFIVGRVTRISPEAPVPIVTFQSEFVRLGGAANVAHNLAALGAQVSLVGVVGRDMAADRLSDQLSESGVSITGLTVDAERPTIEKVRIVTDRNQQVARVDYEHDSDISGAVQLDVQHHIAAQGRDAAVLLVSDYLKGTVTKDVMATLTSLKSNGAALLIDPKVPHMDRYSGATLVTPNLHEAETATHLRIRDDAEARAAALAFRSRVRCEGVLITRGEQGMWLSAEDAEGSIPSVAREVSDVTGAGDTVVATLALAMAAGATLAEAAMLANQAAGIVVGKFGPSTVTAEELLDQFPTVN